MGFFRILKTQVFSPLLLPARLWRSTGPVDRTQSRSTEPGRLTCTKMCTLTSHLGRSTERSTDCKYPTHGWGRSTGRSTVRLGTVDRPESKCSLVLARWTGRSTGRLNGQFFDRWPVDRKVILGLVSCQWADSFGDYIYPI